MAAARQKEMNVSITEDATISRTRSEGGATVVREDPIAIMPARKPGRLPSLGGAVFNRTPCDEFISEMLLSQQDRFFDLFRSGTGYSLFLAEKFFPILEKTDQDDDGRPGQAPKKQELEYPHC